MDRTKLFETLKERGYVYLTTNEESVKKICDGEKTTIYVGIDPTADSLHIGHFFSLMMLKYFQDAGHQVIVLIGGATALIGDPTGRNDMRSMITKEQVKHNISEVKGIIEHFVITNGTNPAIIVDNADWFKGYDYTDFMREIGVHFNINKMLSNEIYAKRLEAGGLTFLEMGYMLMQAYDYTYLHDKYGCTLQIGGSDQWGNILAGVELGRKLAFENNERNSLNNIEGLVCPLLTNSEGQKMGKTSKGALWVAREKTSVFDFYQYFYNVKDEDVLQLLKLFTRRPLDEINEIVNRNIIEAKKLMAFEITKVVHGEEAAILAQQSADALFSGQDNLDNAPTFELDKSLVENGILITDLSSMCGLFSSKSEARRTIEQNGLTLNGEKVLSIESTASFNNFEKGYALLKKGKKSFIKIILK